ncbi:MAG: homocysteine S-methyltransferase family protein [Pseudomonadota bacterium]
MTTPRKTLPQLDGGLYLTDAGLETDLIFNRGVELAEFASHKALEDARAKSELAAYYRGFLSLARDLRTGFVLDTPTWRAQPYFAGALGATVPELAAANRDAVDFVADLRREYRGNTGPILLNGVVGPRGDAYAPEARLTAAEAEDYHAGQLGWLATTDIDMVSAVTFTQMDEAIGFVRAASQLGLPAVISFTVETDGTLPTGQRLADAIAGVDTATQGYASYFMVNCAHPDHFSGQLEGDWVRRIRGLRCNASRMSHTELDNAEELDTGNPAELGEAYAELRRRLPWLNVFGGCCGSDLRHITAIAHAIAA